MELVTGKAGTPHVSSADDGRRIAGEVGAGSYVLQTGGRLAPSLVDANTVRFATGDMIVQGRHIGLTAPEDVKVASGTQGKKRTDYICVHYKMDVSGANPTLVETVEWTVLQGTPGTDATAPSVPAGSILNGNADVTVPVCSVTFDGLTTGQPKLLIPELTPLATLGDSVSHVEPHGENDITFTPKVDCDIFVLCAVSGVWGFGGEAISMQVDCAQLEAASKHVGKFSGGNTEVHQLTFWGVFRGAKAGVKYSFSISVKGNLQGKTEATSICMAVHL